VAKQKN